MDDPDREPLAPYFGDYPHGAYWSAHPPPGHVEDDELDLTVAGDVLRFMWDYGVRVPLWDANGLVPDEPAWLREALGLGEELIGDLSAWGSAMEHLDANPPLRTEEAYRALDRQARALVVRLQQEVGARLTVRYVPW